MASSFPALLLTYLINIHLVKSLRHKYDEGCPFVSSVINIECMYSVPCILRPPLQPEKYGLKWEVVLKWKDIYIENVTMVSLMATLKMEGTVKHHISYHRSYFQSCRLIAY